MRLSAFQYIAQRRHDILLESGVLSFGPPFSDLRKTGLTEVFVKRLIIALVAREEGEYVLDPAAPEGSRKVVYILLGQVCAEDQRKDIDRNI